MLRVQPNFSFKQLGHERLLFFSTSIGVHNYSLGSELFWSEPLLLCDFLLSYDNG
jgi:hypothetical protein